MCTPAFYPETRLLTRGAQQGAKQAAAWHQGRVFKQGLKDLSEPARILLALLEKEPNIVNKYLSSHAELPKKMRA